MDGLGSAYWDHSQQRGYRLPVSHSSQAAKSVSDTVRRTNGALALYPTASVTPGTNVSRHLGQMTFASPSAPTFPPHTYGYNVPYSADGSPPPYTEYAHDINQLSAQQIPFDDAEYWGGGRSDSEQLLGEHPHSGLNSYVFESSSLSSPSSNYRTSVYAQPVFHRATMDPDYSIPTPPGITTSSSSLAYALGGPSLETSRSNAKPEESDFFLQDPTSKTSQNLPRSTNQNIFQPSTPKTQQFPLPEESPDPLALLPSNPTPPPPLSTPWRKRKLVVEIDSSPLKRQNSTPSSKIIRASSVDPLNLSASSSKSHSRKTLAYVEVPPLSATWRTPSPSRRSCRSVVSEDMDMDDSPAGFGGYGSEDFLSPTRASVSKSSGRKTGDRDERAPLEKFTALLEDIFEAEDSLASDIEIKDLPTEFFSPLTVDCAHPLLNSNILHKLNKYIAQVTRPSKRFRVFSRDGTSGLGNTPRQTGRMADIDYTVLSRILKTLDRSVRACEGIEPFRNPNTGAEGSMSPRKLNKKRGAKKNAQNLDDADEAVDSSNAAAIEEPPPSQEPDQSDFDKLSWTLDVARESALAANCCIALLGSDRLTKQLYSEELITSCLGSIKNQLTNIIYPFVEASGDSGSQMPLLRHLISNSTLESQRHRRQLSELFQALSAVLPRITNLLCGETIAMSDSIIIQAVYIAIGPFFVETGDAKGKKDSAVLSALGKSAMRGLKLDALSLIRSIFANHEEQRSWIIEEILSSLIKLSDAKQKAGQFRLRDGHSIRTVSALLLQLVQTSAHDVHLEARKIAKARRQDLALRRQDSNNDQKADGFLDEHDLQEISLYNTGLDAATKAAKTIILFLTQRSGKTKTIKNSNEAEYRTILYNLVSDVLSVLYWPEWPAASLLLGIASKYMVSSLDDIRSAHKEENSAAKCIALEHLGVIAARIRSGVLKYQSSAVDTSIPKPLDEILANKDIDALDKLLSTHQDIVAHLCKRSSEDQAYDSARELFAAQLGQELASALRQVNTWLTDPDVEEKVSMNRETVLELGQKLKLALRELWKDPVTDVFDIGSQDEVVRIDRYSEQIGSVHGLSNSFQPILNIILAALDSPPIFMRTKALRALNQIVSSDPSILSMPNVRRAIGSHLLDSSAAVRDVAVELIGKAMVERPEIAGDYYQKIADRIADTGLVVRKRVIKLFKTLYAITEDSARRTDICTRLVQRMMDEDDTVKDLAVKTIEELWFQESQSISSPQKQKSHPIPITVHGKGPLLAKVTVIMAVSANFKDRQSPLEDILHRIMADKEGAAATSLHARYTEICEILIDGLVDASDLPGFTVINCVRTIHLFASAHPSVLSGSNASTLLPYLKNATSAEEQATSDYLLKIFRISIPHMPKTAAKFGQELQLALQPMILKPSSAGGIQGLQESVACICAVVQFLTHDFGRLVALLKSCNARLQHEIVKPATQPLNPPEIKALSILIFIASLMGEYCDFDRVRHEKPAMAADLDKITSGPVTEHLYKSLLALYEKYSDPGLRGRILQCLGFLFRAQPTLMTLESSATIMDAIFTSPDEEGRGRLLKIIQDFLVSEASKHSALEKETAKGKSQPSDLNMEELVGNTEGFADSGVSSAVVQRYLAPILDAALSKNVQIQAIAIDILTFTIKQGLAHPLQSFPVIVALETSPNAMLSARACALHALLHSKHTSLLNSRYSVSARASFDYQKKLGHGPIQGYRLQPTPTALLQKWYSLVREKRPLRQDFLKSLVKIFDMNVELTSSQDDVDFARYMIENFSTFEYKTQEEVLTVMKFLTSVLSTAGMQLVEVLSPSHMLSQLRPEAQASSDNSSPAERPVDLSVMRSSIIIGMIMQLKSYLKSLYGLSEEKCTKFVLGKKSALGDRPANRRHENTLSWNSLTFAIAPLMTDEDMDIQKNQFLHNWNEDGVTAEPEEDPS